MTSQEEAIKRMEEYSLTAAAVCVGADNLSEAEFSHWVRGKRELAPDVLRRIDVSLSALANICHDGYEWPLNWRSPRMVEIIRRYVKNKRNTAPMSPGANWWRPCDFAGR